MSMERIREQYGVPAKRGGRVLFTCCATCGPRLGTITGSDQMRLRVRMDDSRGTVILHPTWNIDYGAAA